MTSFKPIVFSVFLLPAIYIGYLIGVDQTALGADPAKELVDITGEYAIYAILMALAVTPLRKLLKKPKIGKYRRMVGLYAFFYALLHVLAYVIFLLQLDLSRIWQELVDRPYIIVGFIAFVLFLPLVATSTHAAQRKLKKKWLTLHKAVYVIGILAVLHVTWLKKLGLYDTWGYALILVLLLFYRFFDKFHKNVKKSEKSA